MKKTAIYYFLLMAVSLGLAIFLTASYSLPQQLTFAGGDGVMGEAFVKSIKENGLMGNLFCDRLGAPDGAAFIDTPFLDWLYVIQVWVISWFIDNPARIMVIFYVLTYVSSAVTMFFCLSKLKNNRVVAFVFSLLFSFSTYHTYRNMGHLTLSNYFIVPIAVYLSFYIAFDGRDDRVERPFAKGKRRNQIALYVFAVMLGLANIYFAAFGLIFMSVALMYRMVWSGKIKQNMRYAGYVLVSFLSVGVSLLPRMIYSLINGVNAQGAARSFFHSELFGLKLIQLLLPPSFSKLGGSSLVGRYEDGNSFLSENRFSSIGLIAAVAFVALCICLLVSFIKKKGDRFTDFMSLCVLIAVLVATVGGFGTIFNFFVTPEIRCYCRISIYIICFCYIAFACFLSRKKMELWLKIVVFIVLLGIGGVDQVVINNQDAWTGAGIQAEMYDDFFSKVQKEVKEGEMIYQLPFVEFPEPAFTQIESMDAYNHLVAYIFTDTLKWSNGGIKGRNETARKLYVSDGIGSGFLEGIKKAGFTGVYINMTAYAETQRNALIHFYSEELGLTPIISQDGLLYFYDISGK